MPSEIKLEKEKSKDQCTMSRKEKIIIYLKNLGWLGFFFFLIKGLTLYIILPYLIGKGLIKCS
jgi:hypothetical protein